MQTVGIIAEYNPFHNGHAYQATEARKQTQADAVIAVMSGHFTQRGEIAIMDKWKRAQAAATSGVDLVFELPVVFAVRSAQYFATGGVRLLNSLGVVNSLSFGAERAELGLIKSAASGLNETSVQITLRQQMKLGRTYAAALAHALEVHKFTANGFALSPNNILAVEYLRAIEKYAPQIQPVPVQRRGSQYHDTDVSSFFPSATAIRHSIYREQRLASDLRETLPPTTSQIIQDALNTREAPADFNQLTNVLLVKLRQMSNTDLLQIPEISEGLQNRVARAASLSGSLPEILEKIKTGRYPFARLQRIFIHVLLQSQLQTIRQFDESGPLYARVLAFNNKGRQALREILRQSTIPIVTKTTELLNSRAFRNRNMNPLQCMLAMDVAATDLFSLCLPATNKRKAGADFCRSAIWIQRSTPMD